MVKQSCCIGFFNNNFVDKFWLCFLINRYFQEFKTKIFWFGFWQKGGLTRTDKTTLKTDKNGTFRHLSKKYGREREDHSH
jgi:hypothetical protein